MSVDDLAGLPARVRQAAQVQPNGEVVWTYTMAVEALNELAAAGRVVLGLDLRPSTPGALGTEVALSSYDGLRPFDSADVEAARCNALAALARAETVTEWSDPLVLVTWILA